MIYQNNSEINHHIGGVELLINKRLKNQVIKMKSLSDRVIYIIVKLSERYKLQIIQVYAPTSTAEKQEQLYEDITSARKSEKTHLL